LYIWSRFSFTTSITSILFSLSLLDALPILIGLLAILLAVAIVGPNVFLTMASDIDAQMTWFYRYDISDNGGEEASYEEGLQVIEDRKSTRLNSSHASISYAVCCLKKKMLDQ